MILIALLLACGPDPAQLPAAGLSLELSAEGLRADDLELGLRAAGRSGDMRAVRAEAPRSAGCASPAWALGDCFPRAAREAEGLRELWDRGPSWVEQSVVLEVRPPGEGPLWLDSALGGIDDLASSGRHWSVSDVWAEDAKGRRLEATIERIPSGLRMVIDDKDATYPVTVDPIYATAWINAVGSRNDNAGAVVRGVGDLTGDGVDELAVGSPGYDSHRGTVRLYYGGAAISSSADQHLDGQASNDYFGTSLAAAGDTNGDGYGDVVVGAVGRSSSAGAAYVYLGAAGGPSRTATVSWEGAAAGDTLGFAVAGGGDLDGDGYDEVAVGSTGLNFYNGAVTIYAGGASGPAASATTTLSPTVNRPRLGSALVFLPDIDGDGDDELAVGAYGASSFTGLVYVYEGDPGGVSTTPSQTLNGAASGDSFGWALDRGDIDGDGWTDLVVSSFGANNYTGRVDVFRGGASGFDPSPAWTATGSAEEDYFGSSVALLGDVDGDGDLELAVGTPRPAGIGAVSVYFGEAGGLESTPSQTFVGSTGSEYGTAVGGADWDDDGYADLGVGAPAGSGGGELWVYRGYEDGDGDGIGRADDCDDADAAIGAPERRYLDADGDGVGVGELMDVCGGAAGYADLAGDCDDAEPRSFPGNAEVDADGIDGDCDGLERCYADADGDGFRTDALLDANNGGCDDPGEATSALPGGDCDDANNFVRPDSVEICDGIDDDCDGVVDGPMSQDATEWQADADSDGYTNPALSVVDCEAPSGYIAPSELADCDDGASYIHPEAEEIDGDGVDQDCDGVDGGGDDTGAPVTKDCGCASSSPAGGWALAWLALGLLRRQRTESSSTSKTSVELGGITGGNPRAP